MQSNALTVENYIQEIPKERQASLTKLRQGILKSLPKGFEERMAYGMITYVLPHSIYSEGYHCDPKMPLPFISLASQKNFIALYHMGIYCDPKLLKWFQDEYVKQCKTKLDMGKSCIRMKKLEDIPYKLIEELCTKMSPQDWINKYEELKPKK